MQIVVRLVCAIAALGAVMLLWSYAEATSTPVVRRARVGLPDWPASAPPIRAVLISDIHVAGPDMPPARLAGIVARINALRPDVVLIAGDLISEKRTATRLYTMADAIAPLAGLKPRLGTFAVLGNHDYWYDAPGARIALAKAGVRLLDNEAAVAGPLAIGGLDDDFTGRDDLPRTLRAMAGLPGARVLLSHSPDPFADLGGRVGLMLAGHTHCGQIAPWPVGPILTASRHGRRYACGIVRERGRTLIVGAGLGTSGLPLRLGAPPDMWVLTLGPRHTSPSAAAASHEPVRSSRMATDKRMWAMGT